MNHEKTFEAINKLKEIEIELHRLKNALEMTNRALETKDEPVAWMNRHGACKTSLFMDVEAGAKEEYTIPVYTTPQRTWVGLTDEEIDQGLLRSPYALQSAGAWRDGVAWAIQQLKDKNNV